MTSVMKIYIYVLTKPWYFCNMSSLTHYTAWAVLSSSCPLHRHTEVLRRQDVAETRASQTGVWTRPGSSSRVSESTQVNGLCALVFLD